MVRFFFGTGLVAALMISSYTDAKTSNDQPPASLTDSLEPLREHFNAHKDKHRFVALLSPT